MVKKQNDSNKNLTLIVYVLQIFALINGLTAIIAVIISYVKISDVKGTWLESHYRWQIQTFWIALVLSIVGFLTIFIFVGFIVLAIALVWYIYRVVKGLIRLTDNKAVN